MFATRARTSLRQTIPVLGLVAALAASSVALADSTSPDARLSRPRQTAAAVQGKQGIAPVAVLPLLRSRRVSKRLGVKGFRRWAIRRLRRRGFPTVSSDTVRFGGHSSRPLSRFVLRGTINEGKASDKRTAWDWGKYKVRLGIRWELYDRGTQRIVYRVETRAASHGGGSFWRVTNDAVRQCFDSLLNRPKFKRVLVTQGASAARGTGTVEDVPDRVPNGLGHEAAPSTKVMSPAGVIMLIGGVGSTTVGLAAVGMGFLVDSLPESQTSQPEDKQRVATNFKIIGGVGVGAGVILAIAGLATKKVAAPDTKRLDFMAKDKRHHPRGTQGTTLTTMLGFGTIGLSGTF